ncbi:hypothetical protein B0H13DRAFT_2333215 [Mycena leptocephala]|nr:hypothetical protein B0H13DRAFT_2333215 [Mycena leptocephala]
MCRKGRGTRVTCLRLRFGPLDLSCEGPYHIVAPDPLLLQLLLVMDRAISFESVPHYLLVCPAYRAARLRLIIRVKTARLSLRKLLSSKNDAAPALAFVRATGRLPRYDV